MRRWRKTEAFDNEDVTLAIKVIENSHRTSVFTFETAFEFRGPATHMLHLRPCW